MLFTRVRLIILVVVVLTTALILLTSSLLTSQLYLLLRLPFIWRRSAAESIISHDRDNFDVTFRAYDPPSSPDPQVPALVPAKLHHIHLGASPLRPEWQAARAECLSRHPEWESFLWEDDSARAFVHEHFPHLVDTWETYPYLVQRVDALRYMVLYKYGGAMLDLDLECKRSLEPLRRFDFVAPAAHPAGFSIGMLLSSANNTFVGELIENLGAFDRRWFLLPYVTVMFSTGCHYASTIFTAQSRAARSKLRILTGTLEDPAMHMLNGFVDTPLFRHLGTSSWHERDAVFIRVVEGMQKWISWVVVVSVVCVGVVVGMLVLYIRVRGEERARNVDGGVEEREEWRSWKSV